MLILTKHGFQRLYERVQTKAHVKTIDKATIFLKKVLERGIVMVDNLNQKLVNYADTLYIFKKDSRGNLVFVTVKTNVQQKLNYYSGGQKRSFEYKKNFMLAA